MSEKPIVAPDGSSDDLKAYDWRWKRQPQPKDGKQNREDQSRG